MCVNCMEWHAGLVLFHSGIGSRRCHYSKWIQTIVMQMKTKSNLSHNGSKVNAFGSRSNFRWHYRLRIIFAADVRSKSTIFEFNFTVIYRTAVSKWNWNATNTINARSTERCRACCGIFSLTLFILFVHFCFARNFYFHSLFLSCCSFHFFRCLLFAGSLQANSQVSACWTEWIHNGTMRDREHGGRGKWQSCERGQEETEVTDNG